MHIYIIHGYSASVESHWFSWLKEKLEEENEVTIIDLPTPQNPNPKEWNDALKEQIKFIDKNSFFIAHSLGCISLLKFLSESKIEEKIAGYMLVSGFNESLPSLKQLDHFLEKRLDYKKLEKITDNKIVIGSNDDYIVPVVLTQRLAFLLSANFICLEKGGHFLDRDGYTNFPLLLSEFKKIKFNE
ncbi:MAG: RBBP9/YdeN family alpha/beta hydrolase [Arcobacter sp.]|jgi:predicted alpha/beta hydrolase family esterase|uniref:RBBP9/YdeN family alpha/beta hydrolase n=1 Tax=Arcobacter sp. TaxID=1872629 RepID=UPI002A75F83D|nr:alpha/beta hydrolase [Arcobacter sp.]MDY3200892.1 alpha/beta hydrolase [Arcobacter sp.]